MKDYAKSLKELYYTKPFKKFNNFETIANYIIWMYKEKIKKLNGNYYKFIPAYDIMVTSDALRESILDINRSLNSLNRARNACANELDD